MKMILDLLVPQLKRFLHGHINMEIKKMIATKSHIKHMVLKDYTSIVYMSNKLNAIAMISFEESTLKKIVNVFMHGDKVKSNEKIIIYDSVAGETMNIILGLSIPSFPNKGRGITTTSPTIIDDILSIENLKNDIICSIDCVTNFGKLSISILEINNKKRHINC